MPKKVITRRQRKAAEAKRQAHEDARPVVPEDKAPPRATDQAAGPTSLPPVGGPRGQKRKATNEKPMKATETTTRNSKVVEPSSSASPMVRTPSRSTCSEAGKPIPMPQLSPISEARTEVDTQLSTEQTNRLAAMLPFGTRLCRRIARRFRSASLNGSNKEKGPQQSLEDPQPTLKQLSALHKMLMQKRKIPWQDDFFSNLKYPGRNRSEPEECGEVEECTNELMQKYLQRFYDGCDDYSEANQRNKPTPNKPTPSPSKQNCRKKTGTTHSPQPMPVVSRSAMEQRPALKIIANTGYFILTGTDSNLAQQLNDLTAKHETLGHSLLLLGGMSDHVEDQLYTLDANRDQIFKQMDEKYAMLEPKRQRRQRRPKKHNKVGKAVAAAAASAAGNKNCSRKGSPKKQRGTCKGTMVAPAAERRAATC